MVMEQRILLSLKRLRMRSWLKGSKVAGAENQQKESY